MTASRTTKPLAFLLASTALILVALPSGVGGVTISSLLVSEAHPLLASESNSDNSPLAVQAPDLSASVIDAGQLLNLSVRITGGYKPYNITWLDLPGGGCETHNRTSFACEVGVPSGAPTTFDVSVRVVDNVGTNVSSNATAVTVNPAPEVAVEISPVSGGTPPFTVNLTAVPMYGTPPFRYFWSFGDGLNGTGTSVQHTYTSVGKFEVTVWGNDSLGLNASGSATVHAVHAPSARLSISPSGTVQQGASVSFLVAPSGGLAPFTYSWAGLPSFCPSVTLPNTSTISCTGAAPGTYTVTVVLTDSLLHTAVSSVTLTVYAPTSIWEYVTIGAAGLAGVLAAVIIVQLTRLGRRQRSPPALRPAGTGPSR